MTDDRDMDDREGLAAEYALGTLPLDERAEAERLIASDPAFADMVSRWQEHFAGMNDGFARVPAPPGTLEKIESRLFPKPVPQTRRWSFWLGGLTGAALAALVAFMVLPPAVTTAPVIATLTGENQPLVVAASYDPAARALTVARSEGPAAAAGQDYQLWVIPAGQSPVPLGLVRDGDLVVPLDTLPAGATLAVSLEPEGGSPTGQPTGPVLVAAVVGEA